MAITVEQITQQIEQKIQDLTAQQQQATEKGFTPEALALIDYNLATLRDVQTELHQPTLTLSNPGENRSPKSKKEHLQNISKMQENMKQKKFMFEGLPHQFMLDVVNSWGSVQLTSDPRFNQGATATAAVFTKLADSAAPGYQYEPPAMDAQEMGAYNVDTRGELTREQFKDYSNLTHACAPNFPDAKNSPEIGSTKFRAIGSTVPLFIVDSDSATRFIKVITSCAPNLMGSSAHDLDRYLGSDFIDTKGEYKKIKFSNFRVDLYSADCNKIAEIICQNAVQQGCNQLVMPDFGLGNYLNHIQRNSAKVDFIAIKAAARRSMMQAFAAAATRHNITIQWLIYKGEPEVIQQYQTLVDKDRVTVIAGDIFECMQTTTNLETTAFLNAGSDRAIGGVFCQLDSRAIEEQIAQRAGLIESHSVAFNPFLTSQFLSYALTYKPENISAPGPASGSLRNTAENKFITILLFPFRLIFNTVKFILNTAIFIVRTIVNAVVSGVAALFGFNSNASSKAPAARRRKKSEATAASALNAAALSSSVPPPAGLPTPALSEEEAAADRERPRAAAITRVYDASRRQATDPDHHIQQQTEPAHAPSQCGA